MSQSTATAKTAFADTPEGWAERWTREIDAAQEAVKKWHETGEAIIKRFLNERTSTDRYRTRLNLLWSNVRSQQALLYGRTPQVEVARRFDDATDAVGRATAEILQRYLNLEIEEGADGYSEALEQVMEDRLLPGLGCARVRYEADFEVVEVEAQVDADGTTLAEGFKNERKTGERVLVDYIHWQDLLWGQGRTWKEVPWVAFRSFMTLEKLVERFFPSLDNLVYSVPLDNTRIALPDTDAEHNNPWARAEVWEIWDKESKRAFWWVRGFFRVLDMKDDPYELEHFFPMPRPFVATTTTSKFMPRPDFALTEDLHLELDAINDRIVLLEQALRVVGVYDTTFPTLARLVHHTDDNDMIPVGTWPAFAERGGLKGLVDFMPVEQYVSALTALRDYRRELIDLIYQIEGQSDIMRGQQTSNGTPGEAQLKTRFAGARVQRTQEDFARYASELAQLKAEVIAKHFDPQTILDRTNAAFMYDSPEVVQQAVELLQSHWRQYRVVVKPEAVNMTDFAQLKQERLEVLEGIGKFINGSMPLAQMAPDAAPGLLEFLRWTVASLRGSSSIAAVLDKQIALAQKAAQQGQGQQQAPAPNPKLLEIQAKSTAELAKVKAELDADMQRTAAETEARRQQEWNQKEANSAEAVLRHTLASQRGYRTGRLRDGLSSGLGGSREGGIA